ncbi:unnamed protein product [Aphis gossypii]|uniref:Uncharacterized protein n=1 Tax=Aphis gossypii TaxID=80765 RepID=A0A9P0NR72_APHGO|nr:unnamed protein product [Aphis gossypii]
MPKPKKRLPYNFNARGYRVVSGLIPGILGLLMFLFLSILVIIQPIRSLFVQLPTFFTFGVSTSCGPGEKFVKNLCLTLTLIGYGTTSVKHPTNDQNNEKNDITASKKTITTVEIKNTNEFTSKAVILGAVTIIKDQINIPKGGVLTPAAAFRNTKFVEHLMNHDAAVFKVSHQPVLGRLSVNCTSSILVK